jgi:hypothetical protein
MRLSTGSVFFFAFLLHVAPLSRAECNDGCTKVVADGIGASFDAALTRSAENALMQVVGTFVDAEKSVKKRTEIRGVVKEQTKQVDKRFSAYTQGSIRSLEVLESSDDGGLFRVSSLVGVEVSEFKAAIRSQALSEEMAVPKGLFAQAANKNRQTESLAEILFDGQLMKVFSLDYVDVQVTGIGLVEDPQKIGLYERKLNPKKGDTLIRVHVTASLNDSFMQSLKDSLSQISASTYEGSRLSTVPERAREPSKRKNLFWVLLRDGEDRHRGKAGAAKSFKGHFGEYNPFALQISYAGGGYDGYTFGSGVKNLDQAVLYTFPSPLAAKLCEEGRARLPTATPDRRTGGTNVHGITPFVDLKLTDANGSSVIEDVIRDNYFPSLGKHIMVKSDTALVVSKNAFRANSSDGYAKPSLAFLEYRVNKAGSGIYDCYVGIDPVKEFVIVAALSENELASASNVAVSLFR